MSLDILRHTLASAEFIEAEDFVAAVVDIDDFYASQLLGEGDPVDAFTITQLSHLACVAVLLTRFDH